MIGKKMATALNKQINEEMYSAYLYLSMSAYAGSTGYKGVANWFRVQAQEEMVHAMKIYDYVASQGVQPILKAIAEPEATFASVKALFQAGLKHEQHITACINGLVDVARENKEHATEIFLQWFVTEQIEEEENANEILSMLELAGDAKGGLFMIDKDLAQRVFTPPAAPAE